jgi:acid phosphatase
VATVPSRLDKIKNFTLFEQELAANKLPQYMFITPNISQSLVVAGT